MLSFKDYLIYHPVIVHGSLVQNRHELLSLQLISGGSRISQTRVPIPKVGTPTCYLIYHPVIVHGSLVQNRHELLSLQLISGGSRISQTRVPIPKVGTPTCYLTIFSRKLHENERDWTERGMRPWRPSLGSDNVDLGNYLLDSRTTNTANKKVIPKPQAVFNLIC